MPAKGFCSKSDHAGSCVDIRFFPCGKLPFAGLVSLLSSGSFGLKNPIAGEEKKPLGQMPPVFFGLLPTLKQTTPQHLLRNIPQNL
jgi:hypothetical protein